MSSSNVPRADTPTTAWRISLLIYLAFLSLVVAPFYINLPPNFDQALYDQMGIVIANGGLIYGDCADLNFPGQPMLHAVAQVFFGDPLRSYRMLDFLLMAGFTVLFARAIARRHDPFTGAVFLFLYPAMYVTSGYWLAGQRDIISVHLGLLAGLCLPLRTGRAGVWPAVGGLLIFAAAMIKPTFLLFAPAILAVDLSVRQDTGRTLRRMALEYSSAGLTLMVVAGLTAALAYRAGVLDDWYEFAVLFNRQVYGRYAAKPAAIVGTGLDLFGRAWHWYTAFAALGAVLWARAGDRPLLLLLAMSLFTTLASVVAQGKGFGYHYGGCLTVLGVFTAELLARACRVLAPGRPTARLPRLAGALVLVIAVTGMARKFTREFGDQVLWRLGRLTDGEYYERYDRVGEAIEVARFLRDHTSPEETVLCCDGNVLINNLAGRRIPVRFTVFQLLMMARPPFRAADSWGAEVDAALRDHPPRYIVLYRGPHDGSGPWVSYRAFHARGAPPPVRLVREVLASRYRLVQNIRGYDIYELTNFQIEVGRC
jgi:hypothetical protein